MQLNNLKKITSRNSKRLGRGLGSGRGKTSGRGTKGQKSRSGHNIPRRFEGGQQPLIGRIPKLRGFKSRHKASQVVKISALEKNFRAGELVSPKTLTEKGLIESENTPVKILTDVKPSISFSFRGVKLNKALIENYLATKKAPKPAVAPVKKTPVKKVSQ